ncbi:hypothetical protein P1X14_12380 [Sphingomonas sp. AOB5]|uniref:hypothetical protein n=1 Tax=Sphingomonas sp. AOB5 TaxID=3034017 RepID=UPI0023F95508|nr:hypothetical protein [Sphingomonas sp. AOB5]MDF7776047.1 hypothetical protein [Sphingomonas sp. AOB5]
MKMLLMVAALFVGQAAAFAQDYQAQKQAFLDDLLTTVPLSAATEDRAACASGRGAQALPRLRQGGANSLPDAADHCVTVLIRLGLAGRLQPIRDTRSDTPTPAVALDSGFVVGYAKGGPVPAGMPSFAALRTVAERCLAQREQIGLCRATGYAFGVRAAQGERVRVP